MLYRVAFQDSTKHEIEASEYGIDTQRGSLSFKRGDVFVLTIAEKYWASVALVEEKENG